MKRVQALGRSLVAALLLAACGAALAQAYPNRPIHFIIPFAAGGGSDRTAVRFDHPSGTLRVGAEAVQVDGQWKVADIKAL